MAADQPLLLTPYSCTAGVAADQWSSICQDCTPTGLPLDSFSFIAVDPFNNLSTLPATVSISLPVMADSNYPWSTHARSANTWRSQSAKQVLPGNGIDTALISSLSDGSSYFVEQGCSVAFSPQRSSGEQVTNTYLSYNDDTCKTTLGGRIVCPMYDNFTIEASVRFDGLYSVQQQWPSMSKPQIQVMWQLKVRDLNQRLVFAVCPPSSPQQGWAVLCVALVDATGSAIVAENDINTLLWAPLWWRPASRTSGCT